MGRNYWEGKHHTEETKEKIRRSALKNKTKFTNRFKAKSISNLEKRIIDLLNLHKITGWENDYVVFYRENKNFFRRYLYDIAFPDLLIDIETDGWEHNLKHRRKTDAVRDEISKKYGWIVLRLKSEDMNLLEDDHLFCMIQKIIEEAKHSIDKRKQLWDSNPYFAWKQNQKIRKTKEERKQEFSQLVQTRIQQITASNIDFSKWGWSKEVSKIIGITPQKSASFIKTYMPEVYETCKKQTKKER